jgi:hypothetical protein
LAITVTPVCNDLVVTTINEVLRNELWARLSAQKVVDYLNNAGMQNVYIEKIGAWKRDRVPSLEQMAQIEAAHQLPHGWVLWRAGYIDLAGIAEMGELPPAKPDEVVLPSLMQMAHDIKELRDRVSTLEQGGV